MRRIGIKVQLQGCDAMLCTGRMRVEFLCVGHVEFVCVSRGQRLTSAEGAAVGGLCFVGCRRYGGEDWGFVPACPSSSGPAAGDHHTVVDTGGCPPAGAAVVRGVS